MRMYRSIDDAWRAFESYVALEPRLMALWDRCRQAAPPVRAPEPRDDVYDCDPFESDPLAAIQHEDGWCAEDYFLDHVKSDLLLLAGLYRPGDPHRLHDPEVFEEIYNLLLNWALHRPCACCDVRDDDAHQPGDGSPAQA